MDSRLISLGMSRGRTVGVLEEECKQSRCRIKTAETFVCSSREQESSWSKGSMRARTEDNRSPEGNSRKKTESGSGWISNNIKVNCLLSSFLLFFS